MSVTNEHMIKIAELRSKAAAGTLTQDDTREAIRFLRAERLAMPVSAARAKAKPVINVDNLLGELDLL